MQANGKLFKPIIETKYLTAENTWRYRTILRFFYQQYEKIKYWMYKEEVFDELKQLPEFKDYTMEALKQDLDVLVSWKNLHPTQDTTKASTVEEFKNKQFRYQLTEYTVEIERLTIKLENLFVESASLEPSLLERIREELQRFKSIVSKDERTVGAWWSALSNDFKRLNQNYQDYIRDFYGIKAEELMKTRAFLTFKDRFIDYLRSFIKELQYNAHAIESILSAITQDEIDTMLGKIFDYEKSIPRIDYVVSDDEIKDNILGKWRHIRDWFLGREGKESEASRLLDITNEIIRRITRFASHISESRNSAANRKEEYKHLCRMFLKCKSLEEAHCLSAVSFGLFHMRHVKGEEVRQTESIHSGIFDEEPCRYVIKPRTRQYREKLPKSPIASKKKFKQEAMGDILEKRALQKSVMESYIDNGVIDFSKLPIIEAHIRNTLLKWLSRGMHAPGLAAKTEYGRRYRIIPPAHPGMRCILSCMDGQLDMPAYKILFEEGDGVERA